MYKKLLLAIVIGLPVLAFIFALFGDRGEDKISQTSIDRSVYPSRIPANVPQTKLKFMGDSLAVNEEGLVEAEVFMNAYENQVTLVHLEIGYDPNAFAVVGVEGHDFLGNKKANINQVDKVAGKITFEVLIDEATTPPLMGSDAIAEIKLRPINMARTQSEITFLPGTVIKAQDIEGNAVIATENGQISLSR